MAQETLRTVENALARLEASTLLDPAEFQSALRKVELAADDAECAADETDSAELRSSLLDAIARARTALEEERKNAKKRAMVVAAKNAREELLPSKSDGDASANAQSASRVADEITASLRRTTAVVQEELARSSATGEVVDDSSRRLRQTRDVHKGYSDYLDSGADALRDLERQERIANLLVAVVLVAFFAVAAYVTRKRLVNSNTAVLFVKPALRVATAPVRVLRWLFGATRRTATAKDLASAERAGETGLNAQTQQEHQHSTSDTGGTSPIGTDSSAQRDEL